ncbi:MAG: hypothetical protein HYV04_05330, partial [Deltaproteobacteria bacterium]|nr:hypothetical protein [Deltaproteobacteria bacterium]
MISSLTAVSVIFAGLLLGSCQPVPVQLPPNSPSVPSQQPGTPPPSQPLNVPPPGGQPQVSGARRTEYVWQKMMEGVAMGGAVGGPFGAGGGLVIGLIAGLLTADAHYTALQAQMQTEQAKDRELEAQIEREIERQRELDGQVGKGPQISENKKIEPSSPLPPPADREKKSPVQDGSEGEVTSVAVLSKRESTSSPSGSPFKNVEIKDLNRDGIPDLWIYYNPLRPGEIVRQEEATQGDGRVDTWSYFKDGKLVRRDVDTTGSGRPDNVYYYEGDKLAREERDQKGDGRVTYRAFYENGRVSRVEKSSRTDGKLD